MKVRNSPHMRFLQTMLIFCAKREKIQRIIPVKYGTETKPGPAQIKDKIRLLLNLYHLGRNMQKTMVIQDSQLYAYPSRKKIRQWPQWQVGECTLDAAVEKDFSSWWLISECGFPLQHCGQQLQSLGFNNEGILRRIRTVSSCLSNLSNMWHWRQTKPSLLT